MNKYSQNMGDGCAQFTIIFPIWALKKRARDYYVQNKNTKLKK